MLKLRIGFDDRDGTAGVPQFLDVTVHADGGNVITAAIPSGFYEGGTILNLNTLQVGGKVRFQCDGRHPGEIQQAIISLVDRDFILPGPIRGLPWADLTPVQMDPLQ